MAEEQKQIGEEIGESQPTRFRFGAVVAAKVNCGINVACRLFICLEDWINAEEHEEEGSKPNKLNETILNNKSAQNALRRLLRPRERRFSDGNHRNSSSRRRKIAAEQWNKFISQAAPTSLGFALRLCADRWKFIYQVSRGRKKSPTSRIINNFSRRRESRLLWVKPRESAERDRDRTTAADAIVWLLRALMPSLGHRIMIDSAINSRDVDGKFALFRPDRRKISSSQ